MVFYHIFINYQEILFWQDFGINILEQLEYDDIKKDLKFISNLGQKYCGTTLELYNISLVSIFNNSLIVSSYDNFKSSSLIIHKLKKI